MTVGLLDTLDLAAPPGAIAPPLAALWWLMKGGLAPGPAWDRAHAICQRREGDPAHDLVHGFAHWIEGDIGNADYWYQRAGERRGDSGLRAEWERLAAQLGV